MEKNNVQICRKKSMHKITVPYIDQSIKYPTGCESVSAVMLLRFLGYDITVDEFIEIRMNASVEILMMRMDLESMQGDFGKLLKE